MVKPKDQPLQKNWLKQYLEDFDKRNPIIATRYYVVEVTPAKNVRIPNGDGHGGATYEWEGPIEVQVSQYSDNVEAAENFIETHTPDKGKALELRKQHMRRFVEERWM